MKFLPLLGKRLKDDDVIDILETLDIDVVYVFDRLRENIPDEYTAQSKQDGFQFRFNANQVLDVIFIYLLPNDGFTPITLTECDIQLFKSVKEIEKYAGVEKLNVKKGAADLLGVQRFWARLEFEGYSAHYEFRNEKLAMVTLMRKP